MKKNFLIFLAILGMFLLPNGVFAKEYTFKIGDNGDYNINMFNQFSDWLEELIDQDFSDENVNNTYNLIFEDGNYDYSYFYIPFYDGVFNIYFGKGLYKFDSLSSECCILNIYGKGIDETILNSGYIGGEEVVLSLQDLTIQYTDPRFTWYTDGTSFLNRYSNFKDYDFVSSIKNVVFDFIEPISDFNIDLYFDDIMVKFILDNILFKGISPKTMNFYFYSHSNDSIRKSDHYFDFKNCDFSDINLIFDSSVNLDHSPVVYFSNMKLNNVYTSGLDVQFDCDCSFVNGLRKESGQLNSDEAFEQYSLYNNSGDGEGQQFLPNLVNKKKSKLIPK